MKSHEQDPEQPSPRSEPVVDAAGEKQPYEAPRVESVKLSDEAAESLT